MDERDQTIAALQVDGQRIEYHPPDMSLAYAQLAPLVTEAFAYMTGNRTDEAMVSLRRARDVIEQASMWVAVAKVPSD